MPQKVLHMLYAHNEAQSLFTGGPLHIETHGIEHVVIQVERKRYPKKPPGPEVLSADGQKLLVRTPPKRSGWSAERRAKFTATMNKKRRRHS